MNVVAFSTPRLDGLPRVPPDIRQSARVFGANCGPVSFAAVLGTFVIEVMRFFPDFPKRDYSTSADMRYALEHSGASFSLGGQDLPLDGLVLVQVDGRWTRPGSPVRARLPYTHWVACRNGYVFDLNIGDWLEAPEWQRAGAMSWMTQVPGCTGFSLREVITLTPRRFEFSPFGQLPTRSAH